MSTPTYKARVRSVQSPRIELVLSTHGIGFELTPLFACRALWEIADRSDAKKRSPLAKLDRGALFAETDDAAVLADAVVKDVVAFDLRNAEPVKHDGRAVMIRVDDESRVPELSYRVTVTDPKWIRGLAEGASADLYAYEHRTTRKIRTPGRFTAPAGKKPSSAKAAPAEVRPSRPATIPDLMDRLARSLTAGDGFVALLLALSREATDARLAGWIDPVAAESGMRPYALARCAAERWHQKQTESARLFHSRAVASLEGLTDHEGLARGAVLASAWILGDEGEATRQLAALEKADARGESCAQIAVAAAEAGRLDALRARLPELKRTVQDAWSTFSTLQGLEGRELAALVRRREEALLAELLELRALSATPRPVPAFADALAEDPERLLRTALRWPAIVGLASDRAAAALWALSGKNARAAAGIAEEMLAAMGPEGPLFAGDVRVHALCVIGRADEARARALAAANRAAISDSGYGPAWVAAFGSAAERPKVDGDVLAMFGADRDAAVEALRAGLPKQGDPLSFVRILTALGEEAFVAEWLQGKIKRSSPKTRGGGEPEAELCTIAGLCRRPDLAAALIATVKGPRRERAVCAFLEGQIEVGDWGGAIAALETWPLDGKVATDFQLIRAVSSSLTGARAPLRVRGS